MPEFCIKKLVERCHIFGIKKIRVKNGKFLVYKKLIDKKSCKEGKIFGVKKVL